MAAAPADLYRQNSAGQQDVKRQCLQARWDRERDFKCQFTAAAIMGAAGTALGCAGTGLVVYGLPGTDRLARVTRGLSEDEATKLQVSLMLYGRLGGVLLGAGIFLVIVLAVIGFDYKQYLNRQRPREDPRAALNRRIYADILRSLRLEGDSETVPAEAAPATTADPHHHSLAVTCAVVLMPATETGDDNDQVFFSNNNNNGKSNRNSQGIAEMLKRSSLRRSGRDGLIGEGRGGSLRVKEAESEGAGTGAGGGCAATPALLGPAWRANEAFDASDELTAGRKAARSSQSLRLPSSHMRPSADQPPFSIETEFKRLRDLKQQQLRSGDATSSVAAAVLLNNLNWPGPQKFPAQQTAKNILSLSEMKLDAVNGSVHDQDDDEDDDDNNPRSTRQEQRRQRKERDSTRRRPQLRALVPADNNSSKSRTQPESMATSIRVKVHVHLNDNGEPRTAVDVVSASRRYQRKTGTVNASESAAAEAAAAAAAAVVMQEALPAIEADGEAEF